MRAYDDSAVKFHTPTPWSSCLRRQVSSFFRAARKINTGYLLSQGRRNDEKIRALKTKKAGITPGLFIQHNLISRTTARRTTRIAFQTCAGAHHCVVAAFAAIIAVITLHAGLSALVHLRSRGGHRFISVSRCRYFGQCQAANTFRSTHQQCM